jgi:hypothetical protein
MEIITRLDDLLIFLERMSESALKEHPVQVRLNGITGTVVGIEWAGKPYESIPTLVMK